MGVKGEVAVDLLRRRATPAHIEPVSFGLPCARGRLWASDTIEVSDTNGARLACQVTPLARWPDGSLRWSLVDVLIAAGERDRERVLIRILDAPRSTPSTPPRVVVHKRQGDYLVDTGVARATVRRDVFAPFSSLGFQQVFDRPIARSQVRFEDMHGRLLLPTLRTLDIEAYGSERVTLRGCGELRAANQAPLCRFAARVSFFHGTSLVRVDFTVHNPRRAEHPGGVWDLGDPGSILFGGLSIDVSSTPASPYRLAWRLSPDAQQHTRTQGAVEIYQASSGSESWASRNHVDRDGTVRLPFRGCRVTHGNRIDYVDRASPVLTRVVDGMRMSAASVKFWQQFPSSLEGGSDGLRVGLFPRQSNSPFELQGGEQKTYTIFFAFGSDDSTLTSDADLTWVHDPLIPRIPPEYFAATGTFPYFVPANDDPHTEYVQLIGNAVAGPHSFFEKREVIDEYGWRHFGDMYADHEDVYFTGDHPVISHYNNQYDLVYGLLLHFARSGDARWFELAADLARHVIDIDIYHTDADKPAYNGGLFWHTDHYQGAGRATHRSYSADSPLARNGRAYGGGPSCEHNYATGLLYFHYLTGDTAARDAVLGLADWVLRMDDGTLSLLGHLDPGPTGLASYTATFDYHGPGRGAGNSISVLIDAYRLAGEARYLAKAEGLMRRCIHPQDDPERLNLRDAESRWSYLVFLQALGRYLDLKVESAERDHAFAFAQASLLRYARWMLENEQPFLAHADRLQYPTESWPAQDIRKSCVFDYAATYGPRELQRAFREKAEFFFEESIRSVQTFPTHACARPLAVLLAHGAQRAACRLHAPQPVPPVEPAPDFGTASGFRSQKDRVKRQLWTATGLLKLARMLVRPSVLRRVVSGRIW